jgi:predicted short-subunit dehydrogenase-like oxidoreductase (DUF2520 family)
MTRIAIIGAGKVGSNLARLFHARGLRVTALIDPACDAGRAAGLPPALRAVLSPSSDAIPPDTDAILIAVPDDAIAAAAEALARHLGPSRVAFVAHCSGLRSSDDVAVLSPRCAAGSLHPVQSFNSCDIGLEHLEGIGCGIEGDPVFLDAASAFARSLGWHPVRVRKERKALYHAACVLAGNLSLALFADARSLLERSSLERSLLERSSPDDVDAPFFEPMLRAVLGRAERTPFADALSGPLARGDAYAIGLHRDALRAHAPELLPLYDALLKRSELLQTASGNATKS